MCGIFGMLGLSGNGEQGLEAIRRRGPDDRGRWTDADAAIWLGQVRLSIIDTSSAGHQPMVSSDGRVVMVYNGEIYNFQDLRRELESQGQQFVGHSDSEVLLALFCRYGPSCFERLNGIFAAAFWERDTALLTLVRDPLGVKPLYLYETSQGIAFSSEIKALVRSGCVSPRVNRRAVLNHLGFLWSPGSDTVVEGVRKVLPGHVLQFRQAALVGERSYADLAFPQISTAQMPLEEAVLAVRKGVERAVERQLVADVPLGAFLSGGLDSSAVVAFAQRHMGAGSRLQCFSIEVTEDSTAAEGFADDLPYARRVAEHIGVDLHVVKVGTEMMDRLPEMIYLLDEPTPDPAALNALFISELAHRHGIKVLLSGAGGDDIFTGYRRHFALAQEKWWSWLPAPMRRLLGAAAQAMPSGHPLSRRIGKAFRYAGLDANHRLCSYFFWIEPDRALRLLSPDMRAGLAAEDLYAPMLNTLDRLPAETAELNRMLYLECKHFLADHNLNYTDKMGMAAGVEVRVPLLDLDLVKLAGRLPTTYKQKGAVGKWIFKRAMEGILPHDVIYRPKTGFGAPLRRWLQGPLKEIVEETLSTTCLSQRGIFDSVEVRRLIDDDRAGRLDASYTIFAMICVELWCRQFIDGSFALDRGPEVIH